MDSYKNTLLRILFVHTNKQINELSSMSRYSISLSMLKYLDALYMKGDLTPSDIAELVGVSRPAATKMIKRLVEQEYVIKTRTGNRNSYTVSLTDKALKIYTTSSKADSELVDLLNKHLDIANVDDIESKLTRLLEEYE